MSTAFCLSHTAGQSSSLGRQLQGGRRWASHAGSTAGTHASSGAACCWLPDVLPVWHPSPKLEAHPRWRCPIWAHSSRGCRPTVHAALRRLWPTSGLSLHAAAAAGHAHCRTGHMGGSGGHFLTARRLQRRRQSPPGGAPHHHGPGAASGKQGQWGRGYRLWAMPACQQGRRGPYNFTSSPAPPPPKHTRSGA